MRVDAWFVGAGPRRVRRGCSLVSALAAALPFALFCAVAVPALAAEHAPGRVVALVPLIGVRGGATMDPDRPGFGPVEADPSMTFGLDLDVYVRPDAWFEAFIDRQTLRFKPQSNLSGVSGFDMNIDYLQFGGGYEPREGSVRPFVSAALGLTHYGADVGAVDNTIGVSGSIGGGFKAAMGKRLAFKFEVLGYATINDAALSVACGPGCIVGFTAGGWYQFAARAGLAIRL